VGRTMTVENASGTKIGQVEPRLGQRLINLMQGGNRYASALTSVDEHGNVKIIIRETFQDPSQADKVSFPVRSDTGTFRGYTKDTLFKYDDDDDDDDGDGDNDHELGTERERDRDHDHDENDADFFDDRDTV